MGSRPAAVRRRAVGVTAAAIWALGAAAATAACSETAVKLRGDWGQARFGVEVADEPAERSRGLMFREDLGLGHGMLFTFDSPRHASFWMKNTLIPLDMIFVDSAGRVTRIHDNARPRDETSIDGGPGVLAVLEINGGMADRLGLTVGSEMRHPVFGPDAAWPCEDG